MRTHESSHVKGFIFEYELLRMIRNHGSFSNVQHEVNAEHADIKADLNGETLLIECKAASTFSDRRLDDVIKQLLIYQNSTPKKRVLAFPGELTALQMDRISDLKWLEVWDLNKIAALFSQQLKTIESYELRDVLMSVHLEATIEDRLMQSLKSCIPGRANWSSYQKICTSIFEHLFCPDLGRPIVELSDTAKANRRDIIMANYCESGFWKFMANRYGADFIVVDPKNYSAKVTKDCVLQMINYLKAYGPGMFGIISSRKGPKESAVHTQREVWMAQSKLIIFIDDSDYEQMLLLKKNGNNPEEVIKQKIEDFRLGL
ncbi:HNH endonuclease [Paenibacillus timonensis]|nr:HNH endonuclease [Paenibacillus timonensis]MUG85699.1 HNH endonuclease [Paenibacillus timonensis]